MLNHPREQYSKSVIEDCYYSISALFLINSKRTSKASINSYAKTGSPWSAPFSKLKYRVVKSPFTTHDC